MNHGTQLDFIAALSTPALEGMKRADEHADVRWKRETDAAIRQVALTHDFFTADEVVAELERNQWHWTTHCKAALGPRMVEVSKVLKYMVATGDYRRSVREVSHGNLLRVWRSIIYQP